MSISRTYLAMMAPSASSSGGPAWAGGRRRLLATLKLAIDFHTWRSLERESGLGREEAVEVMLEAVRSAVSPRGAQ